MAIRVGAHPYGDGAFQALAHIVRGVKEGDPFSPVTVVVDRGGLALAVRRRLAAAPPGVVHLRTMAWPRLAAELAGSWLSSGGRTVASAAVELEAVRSALAEATPPRLAGAREQPATLRALARTYRDLAGAGEEVLDVLSAQSPRTADVVDVVRRVRASLSGCVGPTELLEAAAAEVRGAPERAAALCGAVVVHLPHRIGTGEAVLLEALGACTDVQVIVGATGDTGADGPARDLLERLSPAAGASAGIGALGDAEVPVPTRIRSAPSADAEVLMALRHLMGRNAQGVPLERMALLHSGAPPYRHLVHDVVAAAGIPAYGGSGRPLSSTVAGRTLAGALALADHDWRRDDVIAWIASAPLLHDGHLVPAAEWDALSIEAGVVAGLDQWRDRLDAHAAALREDARVRAEAGGDGDTPDHRAARSARRVSLDARRCDELRGFLGATAGRLGEVPATWVGWGDWAERLLSDLLGSPARRAAWPPDEVVAFDAVSEALGRIAALDWVGGASPTPTDFRTALGAELEVPAPETARYGRGLLVGRVQEAVGLDLDVICVVGMVDGAFPAGRADDVLVPDRERERAAAPLRGTGVEEGRRDYLAALASARERVLSYARHDQRHGRELRPARLLLESLGVLAGDGRRFSARELRDGAPPALAEGRFEFVASFADAVRGGVAGGARTGTPGGEPVSGDDWRLRSLTRWVAAGGWVSDHFLARDDRPLAGALEVRRARRSARFTRFDGLVELPAIPSPATGAVQSATGLETFARCPRRYFFSHLLRITARELPETVLQLSPAERGVIIHKVLERLVADEIAPRTPADAGAGGPAESEDAAAREARMLAYAEGEFAEASRRGVTGHPALWALERSRMVSDLREQLRVEAEYRSATRARPLAVELEFGPASGTEVVLGTPAGAVQFRGRIDRVDELADGSIAVVDYKSGRPYQPVEDDDPLSGGERLQLPVYALAAKARYAADRRVRAAYWFVGAPTPPDWVGLDDAVQSRLAEVVGVLSDGIETGRFPARPGLGDGRHARGAHCTYCSYDGICPPDRAAAWHRKHSDPALERYVDLVGET